MTTGHSGDQREIDCRTAQGLAYAWGRNDQGFRDERGGMADSWAFAHYYMSVTGDGRAIQDVWEAWLGTSRMTDAQRRALRALCARYRVAFAESEFSRVVSVCPGLRVGPGRADLGRLRLRRGDQFLSPGTPPHLAGRRWSARSGTRRFVG